MLVYRWLSVAISRNIGALFSSRMTRAPGHLIQKQTKVSLAHQAQLLNKKINYKWGLVQLYLQTKYELSYKENIT